MTLMSSNRSDKEQTLGIHNSVNFKGQLIQSNKSRGGVIDLNQHASHDSTSQFTEQENPLGPVTK